MAMYTAHDDTLRVKVCQRCIRESWKPDRQERMGAVPGKEDGMQQKGTPQRQNGRTVPSGKKEGKQ